MTDEVWEDDRVYEFKNAYIKNMAEDFVTEYFGERCGDYEHNCECCRRWRALDTLFGPLMNRYNLQEEIAELREAIEWRTELLRNMKEPKA